LRHILKEDAAVGLEERVGRSRSKRIHSDLIFFVHPSPWSSLFFLLLDNITQRAICLYGFKISPIISVVTRSHSFTAF
jgi:hypothetical protein